MREKEQRTLSTSGAVSTIAQIGSDPPMRRIKILLLGDSNVGKTSIIGRLTTGDFRETLAQTVGVDYKVKKMHVDGELVQVRVLLVRCLCHGGNIFCRYSCGTPRDRKSSTK